MAEVENKNPRLVLLLVASMVGSQVALMFGGEALFFAMAVVAGTVYVTRHPAEATWVIFFLLAIASQVFPVQLDEFNSAIRGAYRPYILVIVVLAAAMLIGLWRNPRQTHKRPRFSHSGLRGPFAAFAAVLFIGLVHGYFSAFTPPTLLEMMRECSGWITFLSFFLLGYRMSPSLAATQRAISRLHLSVLIYSVFFITKYIYLSLPAGPGPNATQFAYSQRDAVFFSGLVLALLVARALSPRAEFADRKALFAAPILLLAVLLCGARSTAAAVTVVALLFAPSWIARRRRRLALLLLTMGALVLLASSAVLDSLKDPSGGVWSTVTNRFLASPAEDTSLLARASEMEAVVATVRESPLLGKGMLASYQFFDPLLGWQETTFLDTGLGYLLMKTGLLGACSFLWFAVAWLKMSRRLLKSFPATSITGFVIFVFYLAYLPLGPSFFEFQHSWLVGAVSGCTVSIACSTPLWKRATVLVPVSQHGAST